MTWLCAVLLALSQDAATLIEKLGSETFEERVDAEEALLDLGEAARAPLEKAAAGPDAEVASRARDILPRLAVWKILTPALRRALPGVDRRLSGSDDALWTAAFLDATAQEAARRRHPALRAEDVDPLASRALRGASGEDSLLVCRRIGLWGLASAAGDVAALLEESNEALWKEAILALRSLDARAQAPAVLAAVKAEKHPFALVEPIHLLARWEVRDAVPVLWGLMHSPHRKDDRQVPLAVIMAMGFLGSDEDVPRILPYFSDERLDIHPHQIATALAQINAAKGIALLLQAAPDDVRCLEFLCLIPSPLVFPEARKLLAHANAHVRAAAIGSFRGHPGEEAVAALNPLLDHPNRETRSSAAKTLATFGDPSAHPTLAVLLEDGESSESVLRVLNHLDATPHLPRLLELYRGGDAGPAYLLASQGGEEWIRKMFPIPDSLRLRVARALGQAGWTEAVPLLKPFLQSEEPIVRYVASETLGRMGRPEVYDALLRVARATTSGATVYPALRYLGRVGGTKSIPDIVPFLDLEGDVCREALVALEEAGAVEHLPQARALLTDPDPRVVAQAASWLARSGSSDGVPVLLTSSEGSLFALNALRRPEAWKRLAAVRLKTPVRGWGRQGLEEVAAAAGLRLRREGDDLLLWPHPAEDARTAVEALVWTDLILEDDGLRLLPAPAALRFWREWWREASLKK